MTMVGLDDHLKDPLYANWVRNTLALKIVNSVLQPYVYGEVVNLHKSIISRCPAGLTCGSCSWRQASSCPNNFCNIIRNEIEYYYRHRNPSFDNTNARDWKSDAWEVAKCFMPKGYRECTSSDADFSAIVNIVINCKAFDELVWCDLDQPENIFSEARKMRNHLMHSDEQKIAESALQTNLDLLECILNDFKTIPPNAPDAREKLTKLKAGKLKITLDEVLESREQLYQARWAPREFVDDQIAKLRQEIQGAGTFWKVQQHKLIGNFVKGCKYSLVKTMERHIDKVRPEENSHHEWNLSIFLNMLKLILGVKSLSQLHRRLLYPEDGNAVDINDWDLFLLCHMLSIESVFELDNNEKTYIQEIKNFRDKILTNPDKIAEEDLKVLAEFLEEPLRHEIINIYGGEDIKDDAVKLHNILTFWRQEEENMENKQISTKALQKEEKNAERIEALENDVQQLKQLLGNKTDTGSKPEGHHQGIETNVQVKLKHCDKKEEEQVQDNMTSEDEAENIFLANGGRDDFCEKMPVKTAQPIKGSIILKVKCESIKDLVRFWHSCTDGSALRALSKVRDDYRKFLGCQTLDFDIILTKKEVNRCMEYLIDRLSSRISDISALEKVQGTPTLVETVPVLKPGQPKIYDAFVCYNPEGEDLKFVQLLIRVLEDENKLRLFVPWRDDLSGTSHDTICAKLIEKRCKRMIIVLSPRFLESVSCDFQIQFAHSLSPGARTKKLVPIVIERCRVPEILRHVTCCDFTRKDVIEWFWRRLICSLKADLDLGTNMATYDDPSKLERLNFDMSMEVNWSDVENSSSSLSSSSSWSVLSSETSASGSDSNMAYMNSNNRLQSTTPNLRQPTESKTSMNQDYEKIGNVSRSKTSRMKNFLLPK